MKKYPSADLSSFDPLRARSWGARGNGVPSDVAAEAKLHAVGGTALVNNYSDVQKAIAQGYSVAICSDVGFNNPDGSVGTRDADGFISPRGSWAHCMCAIGIRGGAKPGVFILNSWGDSVHRGGVFPPDQLTAGFWVDPDTITKMVSQGDSYAIASVAGFSARPLDWFTQADLANPVPEILTRRKGGRNVLEDLFAIAP